MLYLKIYLILISATAISILTVKKNKTTVETNELALGSKSIVAGKKKGSVTSISASHFTVVFPAEYTRRCNFKKPSCLLLHTGKFFQELV